MAAADDRVLTILASSGAYRAAQQRAYFEPFEKAHQVRIRLKTYHGGLTPLTSADQGGWDVVDITESDARTACAAQYLAVLDRSVLLSAPDGTPPNEDFIDASLSRCGVAHLSYATVLAYDERAFPTEKPRSVTDFFDIERFPGKRALQRTPKAIMEWAMLSHNVPVRQIYDLLSTERGFRLVTQRLDKLKDHIVWWQEAHEPVELLRTGKVVMAAGDNGQFFSARKNQNLPISIIPDGQFLELRVWGINQQAQRHDLATRFIRFATSTERMASLGNLLPYGSTRISAFERIGKDMGTHASIPATLLLSELANNRRIRVDTEWYAGTKAVRNRWYADWLKSIEK